MKLLSARVLNYKSFSDSGDVLFRPGFNVVVGPNDVGKSALLEALSLRAPNRPHRSLTVAPTRFSQVSPTSITSVTFALEADELVAIMALYPNFNFPVTQGEHESVAWARMRTALQTSGLFQAEFSDGTFRDGCLEAYGRVTGSPLWMTGTNSSAPSGLSLGFSGGQQAAVATYHSLIGAHIQARVYSFRAERLNVGEYPAGGSNSLHPNAANLAEVLNVLISSNPRRFERLMTHVRTIFPSITQITAPVVGNNMARILVWGVPSESERSDLAVPLSESGTGVGQVLALLYVVVTSDEPHLIIIDEPQSFLHPGAARKLFEILRQYPLNQYVVSTHSPTAIVATDTDALLRVQRIQQESRVEVLSGARSMDLRVFLADVGASLSDVFGADSVLWVEGKTEEICFPLLLRSLAKRSLGGVQILGLHSTADLETRIAPKVFDLYRRLQSAANLLPPAIAFVLDVEGRDESARRVIEDKSGGLVRWLPRRMFENYLLNPFALSQVLSADDDSEVTSYSVDDVTSWILKHGSLSKYFPRGSQTPATLSDEWLASVHAARLLSDLFSSLSDQRVQYDKVRHGLAIVNALVAVEASDMVDLADFLSGLIPTGSSHNVF
jgi:ABC-type branched-subunit amino acid transport system ATPase component